MHVDTPKQTFEYFNLFWASRADGTCWTAISNLTNNCEDYDKPGYEHQTLGAIMSTWTQKLPDEFELVRARSAALAEHVWTYRPFPYPDTGPGSWQEFEPRSAAADRGLDRIVGPVLNTYYCDEATLLCQPMPKFPNGSRMTNGTHHESDCGGPCCGQPCPGPPEGIVYGGRIWDTTGSYSTAMTKGGKSGIAAADAICRAEAITLGLVEADAAFPIQASSRYKALLSDEGGCNGQPCRRASVTPGVGDGQVDWVIAPNAAYYR